MSNSIAVGVSSCLLGEQVRYDGGHKHDHYVTDTLGRFFRFVPVCPEVGCGLPVPREAMRLEGDPAAPRLVTSRTAIDLTERMLEYCKRTVQELDKEELCGFIFKKGFAQFRALSGKGLQRRDACQDRAGALCCGGSGTFSIFAC